VTAVDASVLIRPPRGCPARLPATSAKLSVTEFNFELHPLFVVVSQEQCLGQLT